jgi:hypothetical protein
MERKGNSVRRRENFSMYSLVSTKLNLYLSKMVTFCSLSYFITSRHQIEERIGQTHTFSSEILQNATSIGGILNQLKVDLQSDPNKRIGTQIAQSV